MKLVRLKMYIRYVMYRAKPSREIVSISDTEVLKAPVECNGVGVRRDKMMHNIFVTGRLSVSCLVLVRYEECLSIFGECGKVSSRVGWRAKGRAEEGYSLCGCPSVVLQDFAVEFIQ